MTKTLSVAGSGILLILIAAGVSFRVLGLGWGIPRPLPPEATTYRNSYHFDEDNYLWGIARIKPRDWNFDVQDYHWGTLQFYLIAGMLKTAECVGYLHLPWRRSFLELNPAEFPKIYAAGRTVSAIAGVLSLFVVYLLGKKLKDPETGLVAAAFLGVAPLHVVNSHFLTSDITMVLLILVALYFFLASLEDAGVRSLLASGFFLGMAISAKYNAAFLLPLWPARDFLQRPPGWKTKTLGYGLMAAGFAAGEPYAFIHAGAFLSTLYHSRIPTAEAAAYMLSWPRLLLEQGRAMLHIALQWTLAAPALGGLIYCVARPSKKRLTVAASAFLMTASLVAAGWPLIRYTLPLIPIAALAAALFVVELPLREKFLPWVVLLLGLSPCLVSWAQVRILTGEHPCNRAWDWIQANVAPGSRIGQIWPELPPLDSRRYDLRSLHGLFRGDLPGPRDLDREFLILDNLPIQPLAEDFRKLLAKKYVPAAEFRSDPHIDPWVLTEPDAPHDWKYTHPIIRIYRRR